MIASIARSDWLLKFRVPLLFTSEHLRAGLALGNITSVNHLFVLYYLTVLVYTKNTVHLCRWLAMDTYIAASPPPLR